MKSRGCHMVKRWNSRMLVLSADDECWKDVCSRNKQFSGDWMLTRIKIFYSNFIQGQVKVPGLFYWWRNTNFFYLSNWPCFTHTWDETRNLENPSQTSTQANSRKCAFTALRMVSLSSGTSRRVVGWWVLDVSGPLCYLERSGTNYPGTQRHFPEERIFRSE
jgi:hypothetical protein